MPRELRILKGEKWFLYEGDRPSGKFGYPIYYPFVICHALFRYTWTFGKNWSKCNDVLREIIDAMDENKMFSRSYFLELLPFTLEEERGFVVVDQSDGCYPLVLYPPSFKRQERRDRVEPFRLSLGEVKDNLEKIKQILGSLEVPSDWTEQVQQTLRPLFYSPT